MALSRVFVDSIRAGRAFATDARAHHLARVVRLRQGEQVEVSDGSQACLAVAESINPRSVVCTKLEVVPAIPPTPQVELHLALVKFPRLECAIEKATELGVATIVPVATERRDGSLVKAAARRVERWERIAEEAAQQARRLATHSIVRQRCAYF
jgi:16S rRNA (uracil1498-N3)-methyltransferase